jgi:hypothetical protein
MAFTAGFGGGVEDLIRRFGVVQGEIDNVVAAALRDVGQAVVDTLAVDWPIGERRYPSQMGPHSADLWTVVEVGPLMFGIHNSADYIHFVHHEEKFGGPPGLAERVIPGLIAQVDDEPLALMSDRVLRLLGGF